MKRNVFKFGQELGLDLLRNGIGVIIKDVDDGKVTVVIENSREQEKVESVLRGYEFIHEDKNWIFEGWLEVKIEVFV